MKNAGEGVPRDPMKKLVRLSRARGLLSKLNCQVQVTRGIVTIDVNQCSSVSPVAFPFLGAGALGAGASGLGWGLGSRRSWTHSSSLLMPSALEMTALAPTAAASDNPSNSLYMV